jgi:hypothetical protein
MVRIVVPRVSNALLRMSSHVVRLWKSMVSDGAFVPSTQVEEELCTASARLSTSSEYTFTLLTGEFVAKTVEEIVISAMVTVMTAVETVTSDD